MRYKGSKHRLAKHLAPIFIKDMVDNHINTYIEPFCGVCSVLKDIPTSYLRIANDAHKGLITMLHNLVYMGWEPPDNVTEGEYKSLRILKDYDNPLTAFAGFGCSWFGNEWHGYARSEKRDIQGEAKRALLKLKPKLDGVHFYNLDYKNLTIKTPSLIYCDPPYKGTDKYKHVIDHDEFYLWCVEKRKQGNIVYVSSYDTPFECIWEKEITNSLNGRKVVERLFKV